MFGQGLAKGLQITIKRFFSKKITENYPEVKPSLPARSHGTFDFDAGKCISCNLCANACPNGVIKVDSHKNEQGKRALDNYRMDLSYCMFCQECIEVCPTNALNSKPDFETACYTKDGALLNWKGPEQKAEASSAEAVEKSVGKEED